MVLVDTSVWIDHLRYGNADLAALLNRGTVLCHTFIIGELTCGNLQNREKTLHLLGLLSKAVKATDEDAMTFIEVKRLMGKGLGYIDVHLLASTILSDTMLWTFDKTLNDAAISLGVAY